MQELERTLQRLAPALGAEILDAWMEMVEAAD
jgi:hypothetical protein